MGKAPHRTPFVVVSCLIVFMICPSVDAQVVSLDPNYPVSLFASGLELPDGGFIYRPATNDLLVNQENSGTVVSVNASTGAVSVVATLPAGFCPLGNCQQDLNINASGQV